MEDLGFLDAAVEEVTFKRELRGEDDVAVGGASSTAASSGGGGASSSRASPAKRHRRGVFLSPKTEWDPSPVKREGLEDQMGLVDCKVLAVSEAKLPCPGCSRHRTCKSFFSDEEVAWAFGGSAKTGRWCRDCHTCWGPCTATNTHWACSASGFASP